MKIGKFKIKNNFIIQNKLLFFLHLNTLTMSKIQFFKKIVFYSWLKYLNKDFNFYIIFFNKLYKNSSIHICIPNNFFKIKMLNFFKINYFFFNLKWNIIEYFLIPKFFWFNLTYLINSFLLKNFLIEYVSFYFNLEKNIFNIKYFFKLFNKFSLKKDNMYLKLCMFIYTKINFILINPFDFKNDIYLFHKYIKNIKFFYSSFFLNKIHLSRFYFGYQTFLNTSLYLNWYSLFTNNIVSSNLNVLILKNLNQSLFWSGSFPKNFLLQELFIWGKESIFFWKGEPYYSYKLQNFKNLTYTNLTYTNLNLSNLYTLHQFKYIKNNNFSLISQIHKKIYWKNFFNKFLF